MLLTEAAAEVAQLVDDQGVLALELRDLVTLGSHQVANLAIAILHGFELKREVRHVRLEIHQHLRVELVFVGGVPGLLLDRGTRLVQRHLRFADDARLVIVNVLDALDVVFARRPDHLDALADFEARAVTIDDEVLLERGDVRLHLLN